ncbi:helix-turn-helix domain-containing protein [Sinorhizobium meliloti]|nr:helix-turn-helix domain-containing protein [Sinorhizobium meliloti]
MQGLKALEFPGEEEGFYTVKDVCRLVGVCRSTLYNMIKDGTFPKPGKRYRRGNIWPKSAVREWLRTRTKS